MKQTLLVCASALTLATLGFAQKNYEVNPVVFDPAGTNMISATWQTGLGCVTAGKIYDYTTLTVVPYADPTCPTGDSKDNKNEGLLLAKTGPSTNNAAAAATINNVKGNVLTELGWDVRKGTHCGAGAPRFNVYIQGDPNAHFVGCAAMVPVVPVTPGPSYGERRRTTAAQLVGAGIPAGSVID